MPEFKVAFVWNRSTDKMRGVVPGDLILHDLAHCASRSASYYHVLSHMMWCISAPVFICLTTIVMSHSGADIGSASLAFAPTSTVIRPPVIYCAMWLWHLLHCHVQVTWYHCGSGPPTDCGPTWNPFTADSWLFGIFFCHCGGLINIIWVGGVSDSSG